MKAIRRSVGHLIKRQQTGICVYLIPALFALSHSFFFDVYTLYNPGEHLFTLFTHKGGKNSAHTDIYTVYLPVHVSRDEGNNELISVILVTTGERVQPA